MRIRTLAIAAAACGILLGSAAAVRAQDADEGHAITARAHGTFIDARGGSGVLSGDMFIVRFEVRNGTVVAIGKIEGSLADSQGGVLGLVGQELMMPVAGVESTCNQLRMDLGATDADVLQTPVHFDAETAGFDSRDGATPKAMGVLCAAGELLRKKPAAADLAKALDGIAATLRARGPGR